ncbi:hypothetical protein B0H19DRAFT_1074434 [Mycena capillaripes]|nr:hypothetical protein B0H19DRAFT_1074434 [Mycena capillaripes]
MTVPNPFGVVYAGKKMHYVPGLLRAQPLKAINVVDGDFLFGNCTSKFSAKRKLQFVLAGTFKVPARVNIIYFEVVRSKIQAERGNCPTVPHSFLGPRCDTTSGSGLKAGVEMSPTQDKPVLNVTKDMPQRQMKTVSRGGGDSVRERANTEAVLKHKSSLEVGGDGDENGGGHGESSRVAWRPGQNATLPPWTSTRSADLGKTAVKPKIEVAILSSDSLHSDPPIGTDVPMYPDPCLGVPTPADVRLVGLSPHPRQHLPTLVDLCRWWSQIGLARLSYTAVWHEHFENVSSQIASSAAPGNFELVNIKLNAGAGKHRACGEEPRVVLLKRSINWGFQGGAGQNKCMEQPGEAFEVGQSCRGWKH